MINTSQTLKETKTEIGYHAIGASSLKLGLIFSWVEYQI
jgi:hypothetical protein